MAILRTGARKRSPRPLLDHLETMLCELVTALTPAPQAVARNRGRPPILPAMLLWAGVLVVVLRGSGSQLAIWRLLSSQGLWHFPAVPVTDDAVYKRLATEGPDGMEALFTLVTTALLDQPAPAATRTLASFATEVVVLDETHLDPVARKLPLLRHAARGSALLLPGKMAGIYDVRRQLWRHLTYIAHPRQNEKVVARDLLGHIPVGSLILADLGYFAFSWFDDLTDAGYFWISRLRNGTSFDELHCLYADAQTRDALVWLGRHRADRATHAVRLITFTQGETTYRYITNVRDPATLPIAEIPLLYHRRWDIERAIDLIKTSLGLHLLWSSKSSVILTQVWAVLLIAQVLQSLRHAIADAAEVDPFDVSLPLMIEYLPQYAAHHPDPLALFVDEGRRLRFIRPTRRVCIRAPDIPLRAITLPDPDLVLVRTPRYAHRQPSKSGGASN